MASAEGDVMSSDAGWQPGCQTSSTSRSSRGVATKLPVLERTLDGTADEGVIAIGNQVATQEGR